MASAWALIEDNNEILLIRRSFDRGRGGQWCPPGGTIWKEESPEIACIREAYEETGLRVSMQRPLAQFGSAYYFLCSLSTSRQNMDLHNQECIDGRWVKPYEILTLGTIMDLRRLIPILDMADLRPPTTPDGISPAMPEKIF